MWVRSFTGRAHSYVLGLPPRGFVMRTKIRAAAVAAIVSAGSFAAGPVHADPVPGTSVGIATVKFVPGSNSISDSTKTALANARWRADASAGIVITAYTRTSSATVGALRAGRVRSGQRARKVYAQLATTAPVTYRLYAAKSGTRAKNVVTVTATGFEATLGDCAAYVGKKRNTLRGLMGLALDGSQDSAISTISLAPSAGAALATTAGLDLLCGGAGPDTLDNTNALLDPEGPGIDLMVGGSGADTVALVDGGVFSGSGGNDTVTTLQSGRFDGASGSDTVTTFAGGCVTAVETVPAGALMCL